MYTLARRLTAATGMAAMRNASAVRMSSSSSITASRLFSSKSDNTSTGQQQQQQQQAPQRTLDHDDARDSVDPDFFHTPYPNLPPIPRDPNESLVTIRARLTYQARKRGILEMDLLLSTFAKENLHQMPIEECRRFDKLMDEPDWDIYYWITGKKEVPEKWQDDVVFAKLVRHAQNEGRVVRQMPSLE
ncbi:succinate dehydrogenase assembly factor 2 [Actinomortierella ambigua]|uniref:Succinate dehydrogenase assembly factor 2, mitochondrial n=1 Tax=Actinomortierella ambigua TaxID=1343610 RepID=A0A9P6U1L9_9FUNG|nr:succinate dehydrogenase assembly factor 2 [Actinomortierella ambigua]KAG0255747.1 succinate dehydrogenase assembly factor 2 [Actinomortierella ambigua]